ncbi:MAG: prepilin peptidase [Candidatus Thorarchaeota archaeon]|nr:prepilin peptidase [Candidatus Thorarchaeota archaeon]
MAFEITGSSIISFVVLTSLLLIYSILDIRNRRVSNRVMIAGAVIGFVVVLTSGHLFERIILHLTAGTIMILFGYTLFRIGSFGGADAKSVITMAIVSPGLEFGKWNDPILEGVVISGIILSSVLLIAYVYSRFYNQSKIEKPIPLIPIILGAYLLIQIIAIF